MVRIADTAIVEEGVGLGEVGGQLDRLPFRDGTFDGALCVEVLEHLPAGAFVAAVAEVKRVVTRYAIVSTPDDEYLAAGHARCATCGHVFHKNLHLRALDGAAHVDLLPGMDHVRSVTVGVTAAVPLLIVVQQRVFGVHADASGVACPRCGRAGVAPSRPGLVARGVLRLCGWMGRPWCRRRGRWLASSCRCPEATPAARDTRDGRSARC